MRPASKIKSNKQVAVIYCSEYSCNCIFTITFKELKIRVGQVLRNV